MQKTTLSKRNQYHQHGEFDCMKNVEYVCSLTKLLTEAFNKGNDVAHLPNGDIMVTETRVVHSFYRWDADKGKIIKSR